MQKKIVDGKVGILVAPGFGAGWSTWGDDPGMVFDPTLVELIANEESIDEIIKYCEIRFPTEYLGALSDLEVRWIPQGTKFRITEYDGSENLQTDENTEWSIA